MAQTAKTVAMHKWDQAPYVFLSDDCPQRVIDAIDDELSYPVKDAERTDAYKRGDWDGYERLLRESSNGNLYFPLGCLERAVRVVRGLGFDVEIQGVERPGRGDLDVSWNTDMELRDYQQDAVNTALQRGSGLVAMPTGAGKTLIGMRLLYELRRPTMITVHRQEIADQWVEQIADIIGIEPARCYGGTRESGDIQVALYQSIYEDGELRDDVRMDHDVILCDEAHTVGSKTFSAVSLGVNADYRYGLTATPNREDNADLKIIGGTGELIADISPESLIEQGYLAEPRWKILDPPPKSGRSAYRHWQDEYKEEIVKNDARNEMIATQVEELPTPLLVTVERINHGERLESLIPDGEFVYGDATDRDENIQAFRDGELDVLIATRGIVGEGFDVPEIESFVVGGGLKSSVSVIQQVGRALRPDTDEAWIVDMIDDGRWVGDHSEQRIRTYKSYYGEKYGP